MSTQPAPMDQENSRKKLRELIQDIDFCMLTTVDDSDNLHSRPMSTNGQIDEEGDLWFFTTTSSLKVKETERMPKVNVSFAAPKRQRYVSVTGTAQLVRDRVKMRELWKPELRAWFPDGLADPNLSLLCINPTRAEYWDSHPSPVSPVIDLGQSLLTAELPKVGEHQSLALGG